MPGPRPVIGITMDVVSHRLELARFYPDMVARAGGTPLLLPCRVDEVPRYLELCDAFILSGGDDPDTRRWGVPLHPEARPIDPERQAFELALLERLAARPRTPVLGICLGMQMMALHAGGGLDQHLPDTLETAADHWDRRAHRVAGPLGNGVVHSHHRQAVNDAGPLAVVARAPDGVIEAVRDEARPFYLGVQWHPERTDDDRLGIELFRSLATACAG